MPVRLRHHPGSLRVLLALLLFALSWGGTMGCQSSPLTQQLAPAAPKASEAATSAEDPLVEFEVAAEARDEVPRARRILARNYEAFLERQPLGFDEETFDRLGPEIRRAWLRVTRPRASGADFGVWRLAPLLVLGFLLLALALLDRQLLRLAMKTQARVRTVWWEWLSAWTRVAVAVAGRCAPVAVILGLSYFPVQAVFGRADWSLALTAVVWLLLAYRALRAVSQAVLAFGVVRVPAVDADRLEAFARRALRLVFCLLALVALVRELSVAADVRAMFVLLYEIALLAVPAYLLFIKSSVMSLLPPPDDSATYTRIRAGIDRYYRAITVVSLILLGLRAAGYVNASTFILLRGYGLLLLVVVVLGGGTRLRRWFRARAQTMGAEEADLFRSVDWAVQVSSILFLLWTCLHLVKLWKPLIVLLTIPLLSVGAAEISTYSILKACLLFLAAILISRFVKAVLVMRVFPAFEIEVGVGYAVQTLVNYAFIMIGFFVALVALGVNLSAMTVVLASLGVGIGFGLQTLTENLISGFILLFGRSVKKGDMITLGDTTGEVQAVGARSVIVKTMDNYDLLIPSKEIVGGRIVNWSYENTLIRQKIPVGVAYGSKPREVEKALLVAARRHPEVLDAPGPEVWLVGFGDSAVNYELLVWFDCRRVTYNRLRGQLNFHVWDALEEAGLDMPFPQRDIHLKSIDFADELFDRTKGPDRGDRGAK